MRKCRVCGCHDRAACWGEETGACWWVGPDLCSACSGDQPDASRDHVDLVASGYPGDASFDPVSDDPINLQGSGPAPVSPREA